MGLREDGSVSSRLSLVMLTHTLCDITANTCTLAPRALAFPNAASSWPAYTIERWAFVRADVCAHISPTLCLAALMELVHINNLYLAAKHTYDVSRSQAGTSRVHLLSICIKKNLSFAVYLKPGPIDYVFRAARIIKTHYWQGFSFSVTAALECTSL